jgi:excinuclease ABC subunit C
MASDVDDHKGAVPPRGVRARETKEERRARIADRVRLLPTEPGCYLMKDRRGDIFYVGKAADLRARVRSYFSGSDTRQFVDWLDDILDEIDVIVVRNEKEALLLERTLVRQHQPKFNVKLRDDKNFIHLRLQTRPTTDPAAPLRRRYPRVEVVRGAGEGDGVRTFGPFHSATSARATLRVLNRFFQLRTCRDAVLENRARPCLQHQIGRCPAPCVFPVSGYAEQLQDAALFLAGRRTELGDRLKARMLERADAEDFEQAARLRDQLAAIGTALDDQVVTDVDKQGNQDIWGVERRGSLLVLTKVPVRSGRMQGVDVFDFDRAEFPTTELVSSFLWATYEATSPSELPDEILLGLELGDGAQALVDALSERRGRHVDVKVPQRGKKNQLLEIAQRNAAMQADDRARRQAARAAGLQALADRLHLRSPPRVIECFDISLFQGTDAVASQVCFVDGAANTARYRRMNIKTVVGTDDFAMLYEAISRRLRRGLEHKDLPDLIIVDGGKGQLNAAMAAFRDVGVRIANVVGGEGLAGDVADAHAVVGLCSIAKARTFNTEHTKRGARRATPREDRAGLAAADDALQMSPERLFVPGAKDPLILRPHTPERFLVEQVRDEAHRFAITAHRQRRKARTLRSALEEIPGVGPARRKALLRAFGSIDGVAAAAVAEVAAVAGVGGALAARIKEALTVGPTTPENGGDDALGHAEDAAETPAAIDELEALVDSEAPEDAAPASPHGDE